MSTFEEEKIAVALKQILEDKESLTKLNEMLSKATKEKIKNMSYDLMVKNISTKEKEGQ